MRYAVIDIVGEMIVEAVGVLRDAGLRVYGSLQNDRPADHSVRLVFVDELETVLPEECGRPGFWLVKVRMVLQTYGQQRMVRVDGFEVQGRLLFGPGGVSVIEQSVSPPDETGAGAAA